jgi:hypothetical protein
MLTQTRSLTLGAQIGAPTVREGLPRNSKKSSCQTYHTPVKAVHPPDVLNCKSYGNPEC